MRQNDAHIVLIDKLSVYLDDRAHVYLKIQEGMNIIKLQWGIKIYIQTHSDRRDENLYFILNFSKLGVNE